MGKSTAQYECMIRGSVLFSLNRDTQPTAYQREALKMVELLYLYLLSVSASKYSEFGLEITQTANRCIKNYTAEKGDFLNYFNSAISRECGKTRTRTHVAEQHGGVHIPEQELRVIGRIIKLAEAQGRYEFSAELFRHVAEATSIPEKNVQEYVAAYQGSLVVGETFSTDDGEESFWNCVAVEWTAGETIESVESAMSALSNVNRIFLKRQERQKPLLSKLLTAKIALHLEENPALYAFAQTLDFFDEDIYRISCRRSLQISAKEIAASLGLSEQSVSRTYKAFIRLL